ncbi:MAG: hypothetical protein HY553_06050 [Elusimicrobia bacterium]|nr:hypothetical protein [Elusimicrobiota bacterium]
MLDPGFWELGEESRARSKVEWRRRLDLHGGAASFALASPLDPRRELVVFVSGVGMNFLDSHGVVGLDGEYQVALAVVDETRPLPEAGRLVANALLRLLSERGDRGRPLRVIGHSFGAPIGFFAIAELGRRGAIGAGAPIPKLLYVAMEGSWRGVDLPFVLTAPGLRQVAGFVAKRVPARKPATDATLSIFNRWPGMNAYRQAELPEAVTLELVTVLGPQDTGPRTRHFEPVANWYSAELGAGELKRLWKVLRRDRGRFDDLDTWAFGGLFRKQGLQNLARTLERDADFDAAGWTLRRAALESRTPEEFAERWDALLPSLVDTFRGHHTDFMWEDPAFMPWLRGRLQAW